MSELRTNRIVPRDGLASGVSGGINQVVSISKRNVFSTTNLHDFLSKLLKFEQLSNMCVGFLC